MYFTWVSLAKNHNPLLEVIVQETRSKISTENKHVKEVPFENKPLNSVEQDYCLKKNHTCVQTDRLFLSSKNKVWRLVG